MEEIIEKLKQQARDSWSGQVGEERAKDLETFLRAKLKEYSDALGTPEEELLKQWEEDRSYSAINYYQEANFPAIAGIPIFQALKEFFEKYPSKQYVCPKCGKTSDDLTTCHVCGWKSYGLFGTLGKGFTFYLKSENKVLEIFRPVEEPDKEIKGI